MYTFSELIWNIRKVGKIDSRKMQGQSTFSKVCLFWGVHKIWIKISQFYLKLFGSVKKSFYTISNLIQIGKIKGDSYFLQKRDVNQKLDEKNEIHNL